jgi:hypothetical protein
VQGYYLSDSTEVCACLKPNADVGLNSKKVSSNMNGNFYRWLGINPHISRKKGAQHAFFFSMLTILIVIMSFCCYYDCSRPRQLAFDTQVYIEASKKLREEHGEKEEDQLNLDGTIRLENYEVV